MCLAIPGRLVRVEGDDPMLRTGRTDFGGIVKDVCLAFVPEAGVGDYVLVHAGVAISQVDEGEAKRMLEALQELDELDELEAGPNAIRG